jgi:ADP-heptose:LPS heptosyltransferase
LLDVPGCSFFSLQVGPLADQIADLPGIVDLAPRLGDFADTAAAIAALDLVVSVDTGVVHLAGALGKPVRVLLSKPSNGFLWMLGVADSPWYPGVLKVLRQPVAGDWQTVFAGLRAELVALAGR